MGALDEDVKELAYFRRELRFERCIERTLSRRAECDARSAFVEDKMSAVLIVQYISFSSSRYTDVKVRVTASHVFMLHHVRNVFNFL